MRDRAEAGAAIFLIIGGLGYFGAATQYPIGELDNPGPGLLPRLLGILFVSLSSYLLVRNWLGPRSDPPSSSTRKDEGLGFKVPLLVVVILVFYVAVLQPLGFALSTFLALLFTTKLMGLKGWIKPVILSLGTVALTQLLFGFILDVPLPVGAIWES